MRGEKEVGDGKGLTAGQSGRPGVLDEEKRRVVVALVSNGSSRRTAARYVGCAPSTISRTMARDAEFAAALAQAEINAEIDAIRCIRKAARDEKHWRAAAWLLERKNPVDFAKRAVAAYTPEQVLQVLMQVTVLLRGDLPEENCEKALEKLDRMIVELHGEDGPRGG